MSDRDWIVLRIDIPRPEEPLVVEKAEGVGPEVGPAILGAALACGSPRSGKAYAMLQQAQKWEEEQARRVKWEKLMGGCWAASIIKEDENVSEKSAETGTEKIGVSEIELDHVWDEERGEMFKIVDIRGISYPQHLPETYLNGSPRMLLFSPRVVIGREYPGAKLTKILIGDVISGSDLANVIKWMKASGERLHKIRQAEKDAERREKWVSKGRRTVRI